jgi:hypothetical protein
LIVVAVRSFHQEARDETGLIDGERVPAGRFAPSLTLTETELQHLPVRQTTQFPHSSTPESLSCPLFMFILLLSLTQCRV